MNTPSANADNKLLESFRPHHEGGGYQFVVEPDEDRLPEFLRGLHPDAVALASSGGVVIEVKRDMQPVARSRELGELARVVENHRGWKLDIVYSTPFHPLGGWLLPSDEEIQKHLESSRGEISKLQDGRDCVGDATVLLLLLWPTFEAAARRRLIDEKASLGKSILNSKSVIDALVDEGILSDDEASKVATLMRLRDYASAGFKEPAIEIGHVRDLADTTEKLLRERQRSAA